MLFVILLSLLVSLLKFVDIPFVFSSIYYFTLKKKKKKSDVKAVGFHGSTLNTITNDTLNQIDRHIYIYGTWYIYEGLGQSRFKVRQLIIIRHDEEQGHYGSPLCHKHFESHKSSSTCTVCL